MGAPYAVCPRDDTPLISTFEVRKKEFHCMTCGDYLEFLSPKPAPETPELKARYDALLAEFKEGKRGPTQSEAPQD